MGAAGLVYADACWELTNLGWGCDNEPPELHPSECILETIVNVFQNGFQAAEGQGKDGVNAPFIMICQQEIGKLNGASECVEQLGNPKHEAFGNDASLSGSNCNPQPGGGG